MASQLAKSSRVTRVYCLIRAPDDAKAHARMLSSLKQRRLLDSLTSRELNKIHCHAADISKGDLGLARPIIVEIQDCMTSLYHCAWKVDFNLRLESFENDAIGGLENLLTLCLSNRSSTLPNFCYCSSIGTVLRTEGDTILEELPTSFRHAQPTGYGQSKLVGEHICQKVLRDTGLPVYTVRIGQIVGDTEFGVWNNLEAIPLLLQTAKTIGALPSTDENLRWLPVDTTAASLIDIMRSGVEPGVFNLLNASTFHWTRDLLPALSRIGLEFETLSPPDWLARLKSSSDDPVKNPPIRLLTYYQNQYSSAEPRPEFVWKVDKSQKASATFRNAQAPDEQLLRKIVAALERDHWSSGIKL